MWWSADVLPASGVVLIALDDDYSFGVLHSRPSEVWSRRKGTQLRDAKSGSRYTPRTTFETFPFPHPPGAHPKIDSSVKEIANAALDLVRKRDAWLSATVIQHGKTRIRTMTNLYNDRPVWLDIAHEKLDKTVFNAYHWPHELSDEQILKRLLDLNLERNQTDD